MSPNKIYYFTSPEGDNPVKDFLDSLSVKQQAKVLRIITAIRSYGLSSVIPHIKKLQGYPLWEIRILGRDNIRVIYIVADRESILLLHGFMKKQQKTSPSDLALAMDRYNQWKSLDK